MAVTREPFSVSVAPDGAFVPVGELDLATVRELRDMVDEVLVPGRQIVLDLAQLTFIELSAIHWLVEVCDATGYSVVLRNVSQPWMPTAMRGSSRSTEAGENKMILDDRHFPASVGREGRSRVWDQREVVAWAKPGGVRGRRR